MKKNILKISFVMLNILVISYLVCILVWHRIIHSNIYVAGSIGEFITGFRQVTGYEKLFSISFPIEWRYGILLTYSLFVSWAIPLAIINFYLWRLLKNFSNNKIFSVENGKALKNIGASVIVMTICFKMFSAAKLASLPDISIINVAGGFFAIFLNHYFLIDLFIVGLGQIFQYGSEIKQENDLTV